MINVCFEAYYIHPESLMTEFSILCVCMQMVGDVAMFYFVYLSGNSERSRCPRVEWSIARSVRFGKNQKKLA